MVLRSTAILALVAAGACGGRTAHREDGGSPPTPGSRDAAPVVELPARPLGMPELAGYAWRTRGGHAAFGIARKAEAREDWPAVVAACREALAADPGHLEAAWLLAVGVAKTGKPDEILAPLTVAASGDFDKWATASLVQPALQPWLATPTGAAWRRRVELDRAQYLAAIARSVIVIAAGDLFAFDPIGKRFYRLTRTYGGVVAALAAPAARQIGYITHGKHGDAVGVVSLAAAHSSALTEIPSAPPYELGYSATKDRGFWIGYPAIQPTAWFQLGDDNKLHGLGAKIAGPSPMLEISARHHARKLSVAPTNVTADWDDKLLASAMRVGTSNRVVAAPSPALIDRDTVTWSPDRAHLAFVAVDDPCKPGAPSAKAYVADAATGTLVELERAVGGLAIEWIADRTIAIAGDHGVSLVELGGGAATPLDGATGLLTPKRAARCTPETPETTPPDEE